MRHSFFLKYPSYKKGLRVVFDGYQMEFQHVVDSVDTDEVFKNWKGLNDLQNRLIEIYGPKKGYENLLRIMQDFLEVVEKEYITNPRRRLARRSRKNN